MDILPSILRTVKNQYHDIMYDDITPLIYDDITPLIYDDITLLIYLVRFNSFTTFIRMIKLHGFMNIFMV